MNTSLWKKAGKLIRKKIVRDYHVIWHGRVGGKSVVREVSRLFEKKIGKSVEREK